MPKLLRTPVLPLVFIAALALSACKSDEEKAADYFQSGQTLLAAGDEERALVEFRNVFKYDPFHFEARKTYADVQLRRGNIEEAYGQYLRLIEQYPDTPEVRRILAELAFTAGNWDEFERHGKEAVRLAPDDPKVKVIGLALDYRQASIDKDDAARSKAALGAEQALKEQPDNEIARRVAIDHFMSGADAQKALPLIEQALKQDPKALNYQMMKFLLLSQSGDVEATGAQLKTMFGLFPENDQVRAALIQWYLLKEDFAGAEAFMRQVASDPKGPVDPHVALVQFLQQRKGDEAARDELQSLIAANGETENGRLYSAMLASIDFQAGRQDQAIAALRDLVTKSDPELPQINLIRGMLARLLDSREDRAGASAIVEEILVADHTNAAALKLRAKWALEKDQVVPAVQDLNVALSTSPNDPEIFELLAQAQYRDGNTKSMGEYLVQAFEFSGHAPGQAANLARFQISQGEKRQAKETLVQSWMAHPGSEQVMRILTDLLIAEGDWTAAQSVLDQLGKSGAAGIGAARAVLLEAQGRGDEALALLKELVEKGEQVPANTQMAIRLLSQKGDRPGALAFLDTALKKYPSNRELRMLMAGLKSEDGDYAGAIAIYRDLISEVPTEDIPVRLLYVELSRQGQDKEARDVLAAGLTATPDSRQLLRLKAGELEADGAFEDAIAIYEQLYTADSSDVLVANNLASLLANNRSDPDSLARAEAISRRLRGQDNPSLQDTYGWIAFLVGNTYGALAHLEPAAKGLPEDALTQYHLGKLYQSMDRPEEALEQYNKALALAAKSAILSSSTQIADAKKQVDALKTQLGKP